MFVMVFVVVLVVVVVRRISWGRFDDDKPN